MKQYLRVGSMLVFIFISSIHLNATEFKSVPRKSVGLYLNSGMSSYNTISYYMGVRGCYTLTEMISVGAELNFNQHVYGFGNNDVMGALAFLRLSKRNKGFHAEGGLQGGRLVSSSRAGAINKVLPYCAVGYTLPLNQKFKLDLQIRPITTFFSKSETHVASIAMSRFFVGFNYNF